MIFGKRKQQAGDAAPKAGQDHAAVDHASTGTSAPEAGEVIPADQALDFMAEMLRILGENAFDLANRSAEEIEDVFEAWARHLLVGVPPPGREAKGGAEQQPAAKPDDASPTPPERSSGRRDLPGLRRALSEHRRSETDYVETSLGLFREAAWAFISGLRRSLAAEQAGDRQLGHRMRRLEGAVRSGDPARIKDEAQETVAQLTAFLAERGDRHNAQITEMAARLEGLRDELDNVRKQAATDPVTGIYNRAAFDEQIDREIDLATLFGKRGCLIMVDIDHFKWVNDTYGHPCGDYVLREVAETLTRCFMRRDDFVARYGGEEFVIVLRDIPLATATSVAERGMMAIRNMEIGFDGVEEPIRITASMGLARLRKGETAGAWVERADRALYRAKQAGRDRIEVDPIDVEQV